MYAPQKVCHRLCPHAHYHVVTSVATVVLHTSFRHQCAHALAPRSYLPKRLQIIGYARTVLSDDDLRNQLRPYLKGDPFQIDEFLAFCTYQQGEVSASPEERRMQVPHGSLQST